MFPSNNIDSNFKKIMEALVFFCLGKKYMNIYLYIYVYIMYAYVKTFSFFSRLRKWFSKVYLDKKKESKKKKSKKKKTPDEISSPKYTSSTKGVQQRIFSIILTDIIYLPRFFSNFLLLQYTVIFAFFFFTVMLVIYYLWIIISLTNVHWLHIYCIYIVKFGNYETFCMSHLPLSH